MKKAKREGILYSLVEDNRRLRKKLRRERKLRKRVEEDREQYAGTILRLQDEAEEYKAKHDSEELR